MEVADKQNENPSLEKFLSYILRCESLFTTPELINVVSYQDKIVVKIENVLLLQKLAEQAKTPDLQVLTIKPVPVETSNVLRVSDANFKCVIKIFLDGVSGRSSKSKFVSAAISFLKAYSDFQPQQFSVIVFLKNPCQQLPHFHRCFKTKSGRDFKLFTGIEHFISKEDFVKFICNNGTATFGFRVKLLA